MSEPTINVTHNPTASRLEALVDGWLSVADYRLGPGTMTFTHTLVPPEVSGRGIASRLIETGLAFAAYLLRHPQLQDLPEQRATDDG